MSFPRPKQTVRRKEDPQEKEVSLNEIAALALKFTSTSTFIPTLITGSYVYKHLLRGEKVYDLDLLCNDARGLSKHIKLAQERAYNPSLPYKNGDGLNLRSNYDFIEFLNDDITKVEIIGFLHFINGVNHFGLSPINSLVMTQYGVRHILEIPELSERVAYETDDPHAEREWAINNIREKRYCKWAYMRKKDLEYFKDWKVIDFQECRDHGIFKTKN